jgi:hypothetical protein
MVSVGLATIASCGFDINNAAHGKKTMNILCIGHGGGSLPLFLASRIKGEKLSLTHFLCAFLGIKGSLNFNEPILLSKKASYLLFACMSFSYSNFSVLIHCDFISSFNSD